MSQTSSFVKVALPYAEALFDASRNIQIVDETAESLDLVVASIEKSGYLRSFLANPLFPIEAKKSVLNQLFAGQINIHVLNFLHVLNDRRRISLLQPVAQCYFDLVRKLQLVLLVEVDTAIALNELQKQALQNKLKQMTSSREIRLIEQVQPELIGGFVVKIGSKVIDMSIYGQLNHISSYLNRVHL